MVIEIAKVLKKSNKEGYYLRKNITFVGYREFLLKTLNETYEKSTHTQHRGPCIGGNGLGTDFRRLLCRQDPAYRLHTIGKQLGATRGPA